MTLKALQIRSGDFDVLTHSTRQLVALKEGRAAFPGGHQSFFESKTERKAVCGAHINGRFDSAALVLATRRKCVSKSDASFCGPDSRDAAKGNPRKTVPANPRSNNLADTEFPAVGGLERHGCFARVTLSPLSMNAVYG